MLIAATIKNNRQHNEVIVSTNNNEKSLNIPGKIEERGSSVNGGELLFLSLATCFCNDVYREAAKRGMEIDSVEVSVSGAFGKEGEPASNISYSVNIEAPNHSSQEISDLIGYIDTIAEVHNTLRNGINVLLKH